MAWCSQNLPRRPHSDLTLATQTLHSKRRLTTLHPSPSQCDGQCLPPCPCLTTPSFTVFQSDRLRTAYTGVMGTHPYLHAFQYAHVILDTELAGLAVLQRSNQMVTITVFIMHIVRRSSDCSIPRPALPVAAMSTHFWIKKKKNSSMNTNIIPETDYNCYGILPQQEKHSVTVSWFNISRYNPLVNFHKLWARFIH